MASVIVFYIKNIQNKSEPRTSRPTSLPLITLIMEFITINQYFYKLYNAVLVILLLPILAFLTIYFQTFTLAADQPQSLSLILQILSAVLFLWVVMLLISFKKIKTIRNGQGLRVKLEKYFYLTIVRYIFISIGSLLLAYGFMLTHEDLFTGFFVVNLVFAALLWPAPAKVCKQLKLRGDEREMVYFKKDSF